jgi:hypothetical protein
MIGSSGGARCILTSVVCLALHPTLEAFAPASVTEVEL